MSFTLSYEWENPPHWHPGAIKLHGGDHEQRYLAIAFRDGLRRDPHFRNVLLTEETAVQNVIEG